MISLNGEEVKSWNPNESFSLGKSEQLKESTIILDLDSSDSILDYKYNGHCWDNHTDRLLLAGEGLPKRYT